MPSSDGLGQRAEAQLVERVGGVRDQLAEEDLLVRVERVDDEAEDLGDLGLELVGFLRLRSWRPRRWPSRRRVSTGDPRRTSHTSPPERLRVPRRVRRVFRIANASRVSPPAYARNRFHVSSRDARCGRGTAATGNEGTMRGVNRVRAQAVRSVLAIAACAIATITFVGSTSERAHAYPSYVNSRYGLTALPATYDVRVLRLSHVSERRRGCNVAVTRTRTTPASIRSASRTAPTVGPPRSAPEIPTMTALEQRRARATPGSAGFPWQAEAQRLQHAHRRDEPGLVHVVQQQHPLLDLVLDLDDLQLLLGLPLQRRLHRHGVGRRELVQPGQLRRTREPDARLGLDTERHDVHGVGVLLVQLRLLSQSAGRRRDSVNRARRGSGSAATCAQITCTALSKPTNGLVSYPNLNWGSIATYTCNSGYYVSSGNSSRTCGGRLATRHVERLGRGLFGDHLHRAHEPDQRHRHLEHRVGKHARRTRATPASR